MKVCNKNIFKMERELLQTQNTTTAEFQALVKASLARMDQKELADPVGVSVCLSVCVGWDEGGLFL